MPTLSAAWKAKVKFLLWGKKTVRVTHSDDVTTMERWCKDGGWPGGSTCLLLAGELLVGNVCRQVGVQHGAEGQAVVPAAAEVCDINILQNKTTKFCLLKEREKCDVLTKYNVFVPVLPVKQMFGRLKLHHTHNLDGTTLIERQACVFVRQVAHRMC